MTVARLTWHQAYPSGRIVAMSGTVDVGAVFPLSDGRATWRMWIGGPISAPSGSARTVLAAKSALLAAMTDWMHRAALAPEGAA